MNIERNNIGDKGAKHLADALITNNVSVMLFHIFAHRNMQTLTELDLHENHISAEGAQYFMDALKNNTVVTK